MTTPIVSLCVDWHTSHSRQNSSTTYRPPRLLINKCFICHCA